MVVSVEIGDMPQAQLKIYGKSIHDYFFQRWRNARQHGGEAYILFTKGRLIREELPFLQ